MFQVLNKPTNKYNYLKIEVWYRDKAPCKGYFIYLQKVNYNNGIYNYDLMPNEKDTRFIRLDNRKRRNYQTVDKYNRSILIHAEKFVIFLNYKIMET